jgi:PAS domain S-box-containing protein
MKTKHTESLNYETQASSNGSNNTIGDTGNIYELFFHQSRDLVCVADLNGYFKLVNPAFEKTLGYSKEELLSRPFIEFVHPEDANNTGDELTTIYTNGISTVKFENRYIKKDGSIVYLEWNSTIDNTKKEIYAIARDVSERRVFEDKLRQSERLLNETQSIAKTGSWSFNLKNGNLYWSEETYKIYGFDRNLSGKELNDAFMNQFSDYEREQLNALVARTIAEKVPYSSERKVLSSNGKEKWIRGTGVPVLDENGIPYKIEGIVQDITEQKVIQEVIEKSIAEKETLLKEIHHRVKNNMQVISSLLNLQANLIQDEKLKEILQDSKERIHSMAVIHDLLYRNHDVSMIDFSEYISQLANELLVSFNRTEKEIKLRINMPKVHYEIDIAVPLGLIINEILTNAFKHAFTLKDSGIVEISLYRADDNTCSLQISDNGKGFDPTAIENNQSLGMMIIENLTHQIDGELELNSDEQGTRYKVTFAH